MAIDALEEAAVAALDVLKYAGLIAGFDNDWDQTESDEWILAECIDELIEVVPRLHNAIRIPSCLAPLRAANDRPVVFGDQYGESVCEVVLLLGAGIACGLIVVIDGRSAAQFRTFRFGDLPQGWRCPTAEIVKRWSANTDTNPDGGTRPSVRQCLDHHSSWQSVNYRLLEIEVRKEYQRSKDKLTRGGEPEVAIRTSSLTQNEADVLAYLVRKAPKLCTLDDIETDLRISRKTAGNSIRSLCAAGLACRPQGNRKGATVTSNGQATGALITR